MLDPQRESEFVQNCNIRRADAVSMNPVATTVEALVHFEALVHSPYVHLIVKQTNFVAFLTRQKIQCIQCQFKLRRRSEKYRGDILDFTIPSELDRQQTFVRVGLHQHMCVRFAAS